MKSSGTLLQIPVVLIIGAVAACKPPSAVPPTSSAAPGPSSPPSEGRVEANEVREWPDNWGELVGQVVVLEGRMGNARRGAIVEGPGGSIDVDGLEAWPPDLDVHTAPGRRVRIRGTVIEKWDLPVFHEDGGPPRSGMPVPAGTDLNAARRRYVLTGAVWEPL
ncbi:MAG: hypothetical protein JNM94_01365 [Phycisphaerae bacterium]|nr:hypothetical protein [Phycisphaerae bacterium]